MTRPASFARLVAISFKVGSVRCRSPDGVVLSSGLKVVIPPNPLTVLGFLDLRVSEYYRFLEAFRFRFRVLAFRPANLTHVRHPGEEWLSEQSDPSPNDTVG